MIQMAKTQTLVSTFRRISQHMAKGTIYVDQARCKGCSLCVAACPQAVIELDLDQLNAKGYHPAMLVESEEQQCTGCAVCAIVCPDVCITVYRETPVRRRSTAAAAAR